MTPSRLSTAAVLDQRQRRATTHSRAANRVAAQSLGARRERARLARELHDSVNQTLFSIALHAQAAQQALRHADLELERSLLRSVAELYELSHAARAELRAIMLGLAPEEFANLGLVQALRTRATACAAQALIPIEVIAPSEGIALAPDVEEQLYRIACEALHNVVKHAGAGRAEIALKIARDGAVVTLSVSDDGVGFDPAVRRPGHLGLSTMRHRAAEIAGDIQFLSVPGGGTTVRATVPNRRGLRAELSDGA